MNPARERAVRNVLESLELVDATRAERVIAAVAGGINKTARIEVRDRVVFAKWNDRGLPAHFAAEAAGLEALRGADCGLAVPAVISFQDEPSNEAFLLLEHVESSPRPTEFDEVLGRGLARLHRASSRQGFGFHCPTYCGATLQTNDWYTDWVDFFRDERLARQVRFARNKGMSRVDAALCDRLLARLDEWIADDEPPSLLHGDLWSGNLICGPDGVPVLVDPAVYFGHREAEFGMTALFGGFSRRMYDAYHEQYPLRPGWQERVDLYTLYHLLNHFNLFGGAYLRESMVIVRRFVG
ncbi:MAG: fructosamine kinase family protein [Planctomycetes bacterium]|nr:fructosamine kinase family protein [Planctomycetota bacterium]